ncbi:MAG: DNA recombination protein RmuC [Alphaproteobacteria bacterium]
MQNLPAFAYDPLFQAICGVGLVLILGFILIWVRLKPEEQPKEDPEAIRRQAELEGRLKSLADNQIALQQAIDQRLANVTERLGQGLHQSAEKTAKSLGELQHRLQVIDKAQENLTKLSTDMVGLQDILSNKQARGAFGEIQLTDLVTAILPPQAYEMQATLSNGRRADCLIKMPNPPGPIAVDAKFPLESYQSLQDAGKSDARIVAARTFKADLLKHVNDIAGKYILPGETAESALMFLPSEAVYAELHANFRDVVEKSFAARVWIVSPTTLMATLNTVRAVLRDVRIREQAHLIQAEVRTLMQDVSRLDTRVDNLQKHFGQAEKDIREIGISTGKITSRADKIEALELEEEQRLRLVPDPGVKAASE